jgi:anti-anti-sigma factor
LDRLQARGRHQSEREVPVQFDSKRNNGITIVSVKGRMDAVTTPEIDGKLTGLIDSGERRLVVDLHGLDYISSAGLRSFLATAKRLKTLQGDIAFVNLEGHVNEVFKISGFFSLFKVYDSLEAALGQPV